MPATPPPLPPGPPHDPYAGAPAGSRLFDRLRAQPWRRPDPQAIGGVCAAVADRYGVDRVLVRVVVVLVSLLVAPVLPLVLVGYAAGWLLIADPSGRILAEDALRGRWSLSLIGAVVLGIIGLGSVDTSLRGNVPGWLTLLVLATAALVVHLLRGRGNRPAEALPAPGAPETWEPPRPGQGAWAPVGADGPGPGPAAHPGHPTVGAPAPAGTEADDESTISLAKRSTPGGVPAAGTDTDSATMMAAPPVGPSWQPTHMVDPAPPRPQVPRRPAAGGASFALVAGLTLLVTGGVLVAGVLGLLPDPFTTVLTATLAALVTVGLSIVVVGLAGRRAGALSVLAVLAVFAMLAASAAHAGKQYWDAGRAEWVTRTWTPEGQILQPQTYRADLGTRVLDLTRVRKLAPGQTPRTLTMEVAAGEATIRVPEGLTVNLDLKADMGTIDLPDALPGGEATVGVDGSSSTVRTIGEGPADVTVVARVDVGNIVLEQSPAQVEPAPTGSAPSPGPEVTPTPTPTPTPAPEPGALPSPPGPTTAPTPEQTP